MVIDGKVYDVTNFLEDHPGGIDSLTSVAGQDATEDFEAVAHSKPAIEQMAEFQVGVIEECPDKAAKKAATTKSSAATSDSGFGGILLKVGLVVVVIGAYFIATAKK